VAANPKIQSIAGVPTGNVSADEQLDLDIQIINAGDEGDVYLVCWCASAGKDPVYPDARGRRLQNWRPAGAGYLLTYSARHGLTDETDPSGLGLCGGCNPDQECWPAPTGKVTLLFETGYLTEDPDGGWDLLHKTDSKQLSFNVGGGLPWPLIIGGVAAATGLVLLSKSRK